MSTRRIATLLLATACAGGLATCTATQQDQNKFSHFFHVTDEEMECTDCHKRINRAVDMSTRYMPEHNTCFGCHGKQREQCGFCHTNKDAAVVAESYRLRGVSFPHQSHIKGAGLECLTCHGQIIEQKLPRDEPYPEPMQRCMSCHRPDYRELSCGGCHGDFVSSTSKPLDFAAHRGDFIEKHGLVAASDPVVCGHCHEQSTCTECHSRLASAPPERLIVDAISRRFVHAGDVLTMHPMEARNDPDRCMTCHTPDSCADCHTRRRIGASGSGGLGPHPIGWLNPTDPMSHGPAARRDILTCAVCHDRGRNTNCIDCHKVGGAGGSPHPPGWDTRLEPGEGRACIWCHQ